MCNPVDFFFSSCSTIWLSTWFSLPTTSPLPSLQHLASKFGLSGHPSTPSQLPNPAVNGIQARPTVGGMKYFAGLTQHQAAAVAAQHQARSQLLQQQQAKFDIEKSRQVGTSKDESDDCDMVVSYN